MMTFKKVLAKTDFVYIFQQWAFLCLCVMCGTKRRTQKLGQHILRYVSKFRRSERDNEFIIGKKPLRKHFEKTNAECLYCR